MVVGGGGGGWLVGHLSSKLSPQAIYSLVTRSLIFRVDSIFAASETT